MTTLTVLLAVTSFAATLLCLTLHRQARRWRLTAGLYQIQAAGYRGARALDTLRVAAKAH